MLYFCLKIIHILAATLLCGSFVYSYSLWKSFRIGHARKAQSASLRIQKQTGLVILPLALIQLASGFTLISLQHYDYSAPWIVGSVIGFIVVMGTWFSFVYFLLLSQQLISESTDMHQTSMQLLFFRRVQSILLGLCGLAILMMIYFMANKTGLRVGSP